MQGLPVFYAPGEAEAVCAALNRAGCVDAAASSDSDTLLYGAETLLHTLKLQVGGGQAASPSTCLGRGKQTAVLFIVVRGESPCQQPACCQHSACLCCRTVP